MDFSEVIWIAVIFVATYLVTDTQKKYQQQSGKREKGIALERHVHRLRLHGVDIDRCYDIAAELIRRGVPSDKIPHVEGKDADSYREFQAKLELMLEEVSYVHRDTQVPGEDKTLAKSTWQLWARPLEEENGNV
jgi:hypothetical protein